MQDIFNLVGMIINMVGSFLKFYFSSKVITGTFIYRREEAQKLLKRDQKSNRKIRLGMLLLFIGILLQVIALLISN